MFKLRNLLEHINLSFTRENSCGHVTVCYALQKKDEPTPSILYTLRDELLNELMNVLPEGMQQVTEKQAVQGCAFIRLYCALKGIASLR